MSYSKNSFGNSSSSSKTSPKTAAEIALGVLLIFFSGVIYAIPPGFSPTIPSGFFLGDLAGFSRAVSPAIHPEDTSGIASEVGTVRVLKIRGWATGKKVASGVNGNFERVQGLEMWEG